ncbi:hypothetical protein SELMODRAFT_445374 [Selaginella moellendorffii]|uniref:RanBD1 domain-containing protein n=1 Tax=Selaginella moellendorffii TaxID=88036 RepID=D8SI35_SELML|nr:hypothetical protein SELMODRAFT_445374 [Selaginella moellendorffii]
MADASNKKRGALRQITKDDRADDDEEDASPSEQGTFARASDEVLATRKIVKVRRSSSTAAAPSGPNLFANIQLVAPSTAPPVVSSTPAPAPVMDSPVKDPGENAKDGGKNANGNGNAKEEEEKQAKEEVAPNENGEEEGGNPGKAPVAAALPKSFDQVSSSANAFGSFGTAFSTSSFSFSTTGSSFSFGSSPAMGFGFFGSSTTTTTTATPAEGGKFPLFGQAPPSSGDTAAPPSSSGGGGGGGGGHPTVSLQEVPVETGEENEKAAFSGDGILYEFVDKSWKERGKGELKLNLSEDLKKARLVMRSRGNLKLLLNASLFPDMRMSKMDGRSVTFACVNSAAAAASAAKDGKAVLTTYAVKLRDAAGIPEFLGLVEAHKGIRPAAEVAEAAEEAEEVAAVEQKADDQSGSEDAQRNGGEEQAPKEEQTNRKNKVIATMSTMSATTLLSLPSVIPALVVGLALELERDPAHRQGGRDYTTCELAS